ncbi:MAG: hypothetical protein Q7S11_04590 [bacterium]|nr:hypothetical protein [bacterium]
MNKTLLGIGIGNLILIIIAVLVLGGGVFFSKHNPFGNKETDNSGTITNQAPVVTSGENPEPGGIHDMPVEPAGAIARKDIATKLGVDEKSIVIMQITDTTWNDGCLGLGKANESCLQALVPGFKVEMLAKGKIYFYRTDKTGSVIRAE